LAVALVCTSARKKVVRERDDGRGREAGGREVLDCFSRT